MLYTRHAAHACTGGFTSAELPTRTPGSGRSGACSFSLISSSSCSLAKSDVDHRQRDHVERQVPRREPRVLPLVRHREDVGVGQVLPVARCARSAGSPAAAACRVVAVQPRRARRTGKTASSRASPRTPAAAPAARRPSRMSGLDRGVKLVRLACRAATMASKLVRTGGFACSSAAQPQLDRPATRPPECPARNAAPPSCRVRPGAARRASPWMTCSWNASFTCGLAFSSRTAAARWSRYR